MRVRLVERQREREKDLVVASFRVVQSVIVGATSKENYFIIGALGIVAYYGRGCGGRTDKSRVASRAPHQMLLSNPAKRSSPWGIIY